MEIRGTREELGKETVTCCLLHPHYAKMSSEQMSRRKIMEIVDSYTFRTGVKDIFEKRSREDIPKSLN